MLKPIQIAKSAFQVFLPLLIVTMLVTPGLAHAAVPTPTPTQDPLTTQLLSIAQSKIDAEYNVLITGDSTKLTKANLAVTGSAAQGISDIVTNKIGIYKGLAQHGQHYTKFTAKLTVQKMDVSNGSVTMTAGEDTVLHLDNGTKDPVDTREGNTHIFHFTLQGNQWILDKDEDPLASIQSTPEPGAPKVTGKPILLVGKSIIPPSRNGFGNTTSSSNAVMAAASGTFNPNAAVNYARSYWGPNTSNYNSAYRYWNDDCTNFISQAMNWGGWQHVLGFYQDYHYWWYDPNGIQTYSWAGTNGFYWFARYSGRAHDAQYLSDLRPGDVLQMLYSNTNGNLDHTMIVTKVDSNGTPYITEHSHNNLDKSFWDIYYDPHYAGASYYGSVMNYQY